MIDLTNINPSAEIKVGKSSGPGWLFFIIVSLFIFGFYLYNKSNPDKTKSITDLFNEDEDEQPFEDVEDQENKKEEQEKT